MDTLPLKNDLIRFTYRLIRDSGLFSSSDSSDVYDLDSLTHELYLVGFNTDIHYNGDDFDIKTFDDASILLENVYDHVNDNLYKSKDKATLKIGIKKENLTHFIEKCASFSGYSDKADDVAETIAKYKTKKEAYKLFIIELEKCSNDADYDYERYLAKLRNLYSVKP
jgi:hypothetical protein